MVSKHYCADSCDPALPVEACCADEPWLLRVPGRLAFFWYAGLGVAVALAVGHAVSALFPSKGPPRDLETMAAERAARLSAATKDFLCLVTPLCLFIWGFVWGVV
jgi:hypothetical protein